MKLNNKNHIIALIVIIVNLFLFTTCSNNNSRNESDSESGFIDSYANAIETYRVTWWNLPISFGLSGNWSRAMYGIINIDNGELALRHAIMEGRPLGDYRLPYWPLTSFVSIYSNSAELAHKSSVSFSADGKKEEFPFRCGDPKYRGSDAKLNNRMKRIDEGFALARFSESDVLKVTNKGSESPVLMEHHFVVSKGSPDIPVIIKATNQSKQIIKDLVVEVSYAQDFNWSYFALANSEDYQEIKAPARGKAGSFFAFSSGMERGYEFHQIDGAELSYKLDQEFNDWNVMIKNPSVTLEPGESFYFNYEIRIIDRPVQKVETKNVISELNPDLLEFKYLKPIEIKSAPVNPNQRITIQDMMQNLERTKVRGLHCISGSHALNDLEMLKDWGGNLAIVGPHGEINVDETRQIIKRGNELGIEMLVVGTGYYASGSLPGFDHLLGGNPGPGEYPDSYGQDEDHSYWYAARPTLDFEKEFGLQMSDATTEDKVIYWSRCLVDKWKNTLADIRKNDPNGDIWFYMPNPNLANIDPLDYRDLFLKEVSGLGDDLTVFPFYYGEDYNQIEYMMNKWKKSGAHRAVFLPGAPTFSRPSQFIRAITAARRGGADGACGFAFSMSVYDQFGFISFDHDWRWKSIMLASMANFPTPELDAYSLLENPAELVEKLAVSDVTVLSGVSGSEEFCDKLEVLIPGQVRLINKTPDKRPEGDRLYIIFRNNTDETRIKWLNEIQMQNAGNNKGIIQMNGNTVIITGAGITGLQNTEKLFLRFAEMAKVESLYN